MSHEPEMDITALPEEKLEQVTGGTAGRTWYHDSLGHAYKAMRLDDKCDCNSYHCIDCGTTGARHHPGCTTPSAPLKVCRTCSNAEAAIPGTCICRAQRLEYLDHVYD